VIRHCTPPLFKIGDGPSKPADRCTNCVAGNRSCTYVESKPVGIFLMPLGHQPTNVWFPRDVLLGGPCSSRPLTYIDIQYPCNRPAETLDTRLDKMERMLNNVPLQRSCLTCRL